MCYLLGKIYTIRKFIVVRIQWLTCMPYNSCLVGQSDHMWSLNIFLMWCVKKMMDSLDTTLGNMIKDRVLSRSTAMPSPSRISHMYLCSFACLLDRKIYVGIGLNDACRFCSTRPIDFQITVKLNDETPPSKVMSHSWMEAKVLLLVPNELKIDNTPRP